MAGLSGARVEDVTSLVVLKTSGSANLDVQRRLMQTLGLDVCPQTWAVVEDPRVGYYMERLFENTASPRNTIYEIYTLLDWKVWRRSMFGSVSVNWLDHCVAWSEKCAPWINAVVIRRMYDCDAVSLPYSLIHGDPTVANAMRNAAGELRLIDPLPSRPYVPPLVEVDVGKLMQSAAGYETLGPALDGPWPWDALGDEFVAKCRLWAAIHCARILPYAPDDATREWAETRSREYAASI